LVTLLNVNVGALSHPSVAVGVVNEGVAGHWIVLAVGSEESTGGVVSVAFTL
jgi:hypothetical protein